MTVFVRSAELFDIPGIHKLYACPNAQANSLQLPFLSFRLWEKQLSNLSNNSYFYVAAQNGQIVGQLNIEICTFQRRRHAAEFGIAVHDDHVRKGIGSQLMESMIDLADNWINLRRLELTVFCENEPAIALYKKFGFNIEGRSSEFVFLNGQYVDAYHMARFNPKQSAPN